MIGSTPGPEANELPSATYVGIGLPPGGAVGTTDDDLRVSDPQEWLAAARVDAAVFALRPDYRALLVTADGLAGGPGDEVSERILADAEATARAQLGGQPPEQLPQLAAWR